MAMLRNLTHFKSVRSLAVNVASLVFFLMALSLLRVDNSFAQSAKPLDISGDGKADVVLQEADGAIRTLIMNGLTVQTSSVMGGADLNWSVTHIADFDGDGKADLLFQHISGTTVIWLMNGAVDKSRIQILGPSTGWRVTHTGDLNGDGKADLIWRHDDGSMGYWLMNGGVQIGAGGLLGPSSWRVSHVADFNGDGKSDLLWANDDGSVAMWLMNGGTVSSTAFLMGASPWRVTHTADLNSDGKADLLWRHLDGSVAAWLMNGGTRTSAAGLLGPSPWRVSHVADLDGDGKSDLIWRHDDGGVAAWVMNGTAMVSSAVLLNSAAWKVTHTADFNNDGKADLLWAHDDGTIVGWLMNGLTFLSSATIAQPVGNVVQPAALPTFSTALVDAARLLTQTTFGVNRDEIVRVSGMTPAAYLAEQFAKTQTNHVNTILADPKYPVEPWSVLMPSLWLQFMEGNDQLRQRTVYALSQILVVSQQNNTLGDQACSIAGYLDILGRHAFGNFRDILKDVTLSPAMGLYLDMKQSAKADPVLNAVPNENFARELLQLFSIGTVMLNQDGSVQFDANGKAKETYSEETVQQFARALTGWNFAGQDQTKPWRWLYPDVPYPSDATSAAKACTAWSSPMQPWTATYRSSDDKRDITGGAHDVTAKTLLTYSGSQNFKQNLPAGQTAQLDMDGVIDNVFNHPNVGPFIGEQLIQRLVTSNPSGGYVARVAAAFNNNGSGVRGDMKAVLRAILLDPEARVLPRSQPTSYGKLREPVLRFTHLHRAFNAKMQNGSYRSIWDLGGSDALGQSPVRPPSVFNFYHPDYTPSGILQQAGLYGPEFEITNSATISGFMDFSKWGIVGGFGQYESDSGKWMKPNYDYYTGLSTTPAAMVDQLDLVLLSGTMSQQLRAQLIDVATRLTDSNATTQATERFKTVFWLIISSPEYSIQK
jgi:uncharacterized protein (DUF1800 family)